MEISTADLYDERGDELESCATQLRSYGGRAWFSGTIVTVKCLRDNVQVDQLLDSPGEGRVLVVDGDGVLDTALMGDRLAGNPGRVPGADVGSVAGDRMSVERPPLRRSPQPARYRAARGIRHRATPPAVPPTNW